ncbi:acetyl-CoA C-acyltransferase [Immundisolibacter sp.]|uniref:acetyl-CoA C-acyltransferase n=1 Tax=Immundisolibacter sp. TaxID=1934948 RepID=UPI000EE7ECB3|nr:acetyl-CoA C-acetyltransferase [Gammaproteobacteria bacterium]
MSTGVVIVAARRTAMGGFQGQFASLSASDLGAAAIAAAVADVGVDGADIQDAHIGCVLPAGQGQAPGRQAVLKAGLPLSVPVTTVNKMCGSAMKAIMYAIDQIRCGDVQVALAGGMESMTNAPYILPKVRQGLRMGHGEVLDHMFCDGLQDVREGLLMGAFAERCADKHGFSRQAQDAYAIESLTRALRATNEGESASEIVPVTVKTKTGDVVYDKDEQPLTARLDKIPTLKPAFKKDGTVTAANASSISDGAAALVLMSEEEAARRGLKPLARVLGHATHAQDPAWFTTAPVGAVRTLLNKLGWSADKPDLYEVNEAFAVVPMTVMQELGIGHEKMNVFGGACALGHPVGASGARIVVTLLNALRRRGGKYGVAGICLAGGEATALAVELL